MPLIFYLYKEDYVFINILFVCLFVGQAGLWKTAQLIFIKLGGKVDIGLK